VAQDGRREPVEPGHGVYDDPRRLGDSLAVCTLRWPRSRSCRMLRRPASTSPGSSRTTAKSMTPDRSLSSLNAHMNKTVEPTSDGLPMHFLRARIAHGAPELALIHRPPKDENPGHA
jgi:hypothetical protein